MSDSKPGFRTDCAVDATMSIIGGKWKPTVLCKLIVKGDMRFSELAEEIPQVSSKVLANQLRELERDGLVFRTESAEPPVRVTYGVTERGMTLAPALAALAEWALGNLPMNMVRLDDDMRAGDAGDWD
ncbi:MAG: helix-turn-helix transcriptional regulator [Euryarchaeota archaeon]|nr:helix-turn-helix transcriptional regulator [Euryarchaeota archaeon]